MPRVGEMIESKFLKKEDVEPPVLVTIDSVRQNNVAMQGADPEMKWCLYLKELDKPLVLNSTNIHLCAQACQSDDTDEWVGHQVILYNDPNVSFGGKLTGGIRIRMKQKVVEPVVPTRKGGSSTVGKGEIKDDIPF